MPVSVTERYRLVPHSGKCSSSGCARHSTAYPSGSNTARTNASPPAAGSTSIVAVSGIGVAASPGRVLQVPLSALPKTWAMATLKNEVAVYGRSLTYWPIVNRRSKFPSRTRPTGSTSRARATVVRSSVASG